MFGLSLGTLGGPPAGLVPSAPPPSPPQAPVTNFSAAQTTGAYPFNALFTDESTNTPTSWAWDFGDGATSTAQNPTHTYAAAGTYTVSLTATNAAGSDTETKTGYITVTVPEPVLVASTTSTSGVPAMPTHKAGDLLIVAALSSASDCTPPRQSTTAGWETLKILPGSVG